MLINNNFFFSSVDYENSFDIIPVDYLSNALIVIGFYLSLKSTKQTIDDNSVTVVHITSNPNNQTTLKEIVHYYKQFAINYASTKVMLPINNPLRIKSKLGTIKHYFKLLIYQIIFPHIMDTILLLLNKKPFLKLVINKCNRSLNLYQHFTINQWIFINDNYPKIFNQLTAKEQSLFPSNMADIDWAQYCKAMYFGTRRYLLNENDSTIESGRQRLRFIARLHLFITYLLIFLFITIILIILFY